MKHALKAFMNAVMNKETATEFNLRQATCTVDETMYWAEHIGGENEFTELYGHIDIMEEDDDVDVDTTGAAIRTYDSSEDDEDDDENFGMYGTWFRG